MNWNQMTIGYRLKLALIVRRMKYNVGTNILKWGISFYFSKEQNQANIRLHRMCTMCHLGIYLTQRQRHKTLIPSI